MENLPLYISVVFVITTALTLFLLYKATHRSKTVLVVSSAWLAVQAIIGLSGFYTITNSIPPRFAFLIFPPLALIVFLFVTEKGRTFITTLNAKWLMLLHTVRILVEVVLLWLSIQKFVPGLMTFEGRNFDILSGLTAPFVFYFGYIKKSLHRNILLLWNFVCLALLINIITIAILSAPFPFQKLAFEQPNIALLHFPFMWLPAFIVPVVLFSHLVCIRHLMLQKKANLHQTSLENNFA